MLIAGAWLVMTVLKLNECVTGRDGRWSMTVSATDEGIAVLIESVLIYEAQHCPYRE
jgi:hypothetical protein